ncbi:hypothetical protein P0M04_30275 [Telluria mixta]|nr:hypothetical protein [Telluria mixta]WEM95708.1 hypothetical protein P0M04_30275 [Telluria mixta]
MMTSVNVPDSFAAPALALSDWIASARSYTALRCASSGACWTPGPWRRP